MDEGFKLTKKQMFITLGIILTAGVFFLAIQAIIYFNLQYEKSLIENEDLTQVLGAIQIDPFENLSLSAKAFLVWDVNDQKKIASLNEEMQLPLASLVKLMTAYVVSGNAKNDLILTVKDKNLEKEGDNGLILGEEWTLLNMIEFVLLSSSNDGANALASVVSSLNQDTSLETFIRKMNNTAEELGMAQSFFLNESGLDINESISGAYGSARDMTILLENILKESPNLLEVSTQKEKMISSEITTHQIKNTNIIIDKLPGVIASKTGFTDLAGGNLIMAFDIGLGHSIIISVLGSTKEDRFNDVEKLFWASIENEFNKSSLVDKNNKQIL